MTDLRSEWPGPADQVGWRRVVLSGSLGACPPGHAVDAVRALCPGSDHALVKALTVHLSDQMMRRLRSLVDTDRPDSGEDVIARAHEALMAAVFDLDDPGATALVEAFWPWRRYRGVDAPARRATPLGPGPFP